MLALCLLGGVSYWVYTTINMAPSPVPEDAFDPLTSSAGPTVTMGTIPNLPTPMMRSPAVVGPTAGAPSSAGPMDALRGVVAGTTPATPLNGPNVGRSANELASGYGAPPMPTVPVPSLPPVAVDQGFEQTMGVVQSYLQSDRLTEALRLLTEWYDDPRLTPQQNAQTLVLLDQLAATVVYSRQHRLTAPYEVQPGDTLEKIAERYQVPWQLLGKINSLSNPRQLRPADRLKVLPGPFEAYVDLTQYRLTLVIDGLYAGRFPIGIGRDQSTPQGSFVVKNKVLNPVWYGPQGVVPHEDPRNPLGGRWIDLGGGIGIHGTNNPASIGRNESEGCIRMGQQDIEDVFDILSLGSRVTVLSPAPAATSLAERPTAFTPGSTQ